MTDNHRSLDQIMSDKRMIANARTALDKNETALNKELEVLHNAVKEAMK